MTTAITRTILTWQGVAATRLESVRLLVADDGRLKASGRLIAAAGDEQAYSASFEAATDQSGAFSRLLIRATMAEEERQISVNRTEDGLWLVDRGQGSSERTTFDGALEVDVAGAVLFNSLPIRRLALHKESGRHELPVVYVSLPDLAVRVSKQTYTTVSIGDGTSVVNYADETFSADLTVDENGFVIDYPGLARRV